jgi:hypothetical protein
MTFEDPVAGKEGDALHHTMVNGGRVGLRASSLSG